MLNWLQTKIQSLAKGRVMLILVVAVIALRIVMGLPNDPFGLNPELERAGVQILDLQIGYTPDEAYEQLEALGETGRSAYARMLIGGDFLFPLGYSLLFASIAAWLLARVAPPEHWTQKLSLIALLGGLCDWIENILQLAMIRAFPQRLDVIAWLSSWIKIPKFGSGALGIPLIVALLVMYVWQRVSSRKPTETD